VILKKVSELAAVDDDDVSPDPHLRLVPVEGVKVMRQRKFIQDSRNRRECRLAERDFAGIAVHVGGVEVADQQFCRRDN
jgi:hypothetical protein